MQVKLGEKIKELRKRDGRKQEDLAAALGVTNQAVSRWEQSGGYPDIELIPAIANYFHITIDELFGYDNDRQTKLRSYIEQADKMLKDGDHVRLAEFLRNAVSEFPSEWQLQYRLANALITVGRNHETHETVVSENGYFRFDTENNAQNECWKEAISLFEEVLKKEIDDSYRTTAISCLISLYLKTGDFKNAERTALSQSPVSISREVLLTWAAEDEKGDEYRANAILVLMHELNGVIGSSVMRKHSFAYSRAGIDKLLAAARLYESIIDDGNFGRFHNDLCLLYLRCFVIAVRLNDYEGALEYFKTALDHFIGFKREGENFGFTAPLVGKARLGADAVSITELNRELFERHMESLPLEYADEVRNDTRYSGIFV